MAKFSLQTIAAIAEAVTGGSAAGGTPSVGRYRAGWELKKFFADLGIHLVVNSRVPSVRELLEKLNGQPDGQQTLAKVIEHACDPRDYLDEPEKLTAVVAYLNKRLSFDGFELRLVGRRYRLVQTDNGAPAASALREHIAAFDLEAVRQDFDRALAEGDPEDAITAACSTVESVCKCLLDELGQPYPARQDVQGLVKEVSKHLNLSPDRGDLPADIKQILGGLATVSGGIGSLRTHAGDAHGRGKKAVRVDGRIARLAINAACTISLFYVETWQRMKSLAAQNGGGSPGVR